MLRDARIRLVLAGALAALATTSLVIGLLYWTANRIIETETRNIVRAELDGLADSYANRGLLGLVLAIERRTESGEEPDAVYLLTDRRGRVLAGNLGAWPPNADPEADWLELELIRTDSGRRVPIAAAPVSLPSGERLLVGRDASASARFDRVLGQSVILALGAALILSLVLAWLLSRLVFSRLGEIDRTANEIVSGDLGRRIPLRGTGDEFDRLGRTLNAMLDRIEELVANLKITTEGLAHDLRSPLTRLRSYVDGLADPGRGEAERARLSELAVDEIDRVLRMFSDLTEIARADARLARDEFAPVALAPLAEELAEFYRPLAAEHGIGIAVSGEAPPVPGHQALLSLAVSNLLDNAIRYAPQGSVIDVAISAGEGVVGVTVRDRGSGVPDADLERLARPFVTRDESRTGSHSGLGLALVASVARLHDGALRLENAHPGLRATLSLAAG